MDIDLFLQQKIPLPKLFEQEKILKSYQIDMNAASAFQQELLRTENQTKKYFNVELGVEETKSQLKNYGLQIINYADMTKWALSHVLKNTSVSFESAKHESKKIKDILIFFEGGKTPSKRREDFWDGDVAWASPKDFNGLYLDDTIDKITPLAVNETGLRIFPKGVFLSVFRSGILQHSFPTVLTNIETTINQDLKAYQINETIIDRYYYLFFVHAFKAYILKKSSKKSATVESINTEDFLEIPIPLPPMLVQQKIASTVEKLHNEIQSLQVSIRVKRQQAQTNFEHEIFG
jgi:type I restriction enzyme S subunit